MVIRMTERQAREAYKLVKKECCNYKDGICIVLDCPCPQLITRSLNCKWFRNAVLPGNVPLYMEITGKTSKTKACAACGKLFEPQSNRSCYCESCYRERRRQQKREYMRRKRQEVDK